MWATIEDAWGLPFEYGIIKVGSKRSFQETSQEKREKAIDEKFLFIKEFIEGKRVAVVDDSNVRGTTARKLARKLFDLGAREVHLYYFCPAVIGPCFYGIDTPDESRLVAAGRTNEQIREWIGATSVNYISVAGLIEGLGLPEDELCLACVTRRYPTSVKEAPERVALRNAEREACAEWPKSRAASRRGARIPREHGDVGQHRCCRTLVCTGPRGGWRAAAGRVGCRRASRANSWHDGRFELRSTVRLC